MGSERNKGEKKAARSLPPLAHGAVSHKDLDYYRDESDIPFSTANAQTIVFFVWEHSLPEDRERIRTQKEPGLAQTILKVKVRLLPFLFALYVVAFVDRINLGFAALTMSQDSGSAPAVRPGSGYLLLGLFSL